MTSSTEPGTRTLPAVHEAWLPREHSLYRPRHGSRQVTALVCALVFFVTPTFMWLLGARPVEIENHKLAGFPTPAAGWGFFTGLDAWATDNLVFRPDAIVATDWISRVLFGESAPFDLGGGPPAGPLPGSGGEERAEPRTPGGPAGGADRAGFRRVIEGSDGWLYFGEDVLAKCRPSRPLDETLRQFAALRKVVEDSGRRFVLVAVPDKTTMVPEHLPASYSGRDCAAKVSPVLWRNATTLAGAMDLRPVLNKVAADRGGRPAYYPQDTHWTHEGAVAMVSTLAESIRPGITRRWNIGRKNDYRGSADLPPMIGRTGDKDVTLYALAPDGKVDKTRGEIFDLARPVHMSTGRTSGMINQRTVVLGDSFAIAASPYLPAAFSDVTMVNYDSIGGDASAAISAMADSEIVVFQVIERNIAGGGLPMLEQDFIDALGQELARR